ncbi:hypothetical protein BIV57_18970 [Mangrovactinospora gilvigrisea]|uniref:PPM-type phosphatase domain-containing protein n=1 Tax=Mangrovactinospora gilvigrisea TaxID=1428644 RepID=A0A1J7BBB8_9ACTN|nr:PP2C family protein-serine/threonine phosphatase [Mangrovactinospora gilvigrisea]OIV35918.1 hypothetical protein BIV57_18970 [Mangrovactinospora gilvigrisea]
MRPQQLTTGRRTAGLRVRVWVTCLLIIVGGVAYDLFTPPGYTATFVLTVPPAIAAISMRRIDAVIITLLSVGTATAMVFLWHWHDGEAMLELYLQYLLAAISLYVCWERYRRESELQTARTIAETAQRAVLPTLPPRLGGMRVSARYSAAYSPARIGGDFYAVEDSPFGLRAVVGDVRGKGLGTIDTVAALTGTFREAAHHARDLAQAARWMEAAQLRLASTRRRAAEAEDGEGAESEYELESFATAVLVELTEDRRELRVVNCGHPQPLRLRGETVEPIAPAFSRAPLGLGPLVGDTSGGPIGVVPWTPGDVLLLFTDGLVEARDSAGEFYDPRPLLARRGADAPLDLLLRHLGEDARRHSGGRLGDDLALLAIA